ncbi:MAG: hypothetical protein FD138_91 [Planctomycetota bacterium]|nr:MAG: hypothetical protein FD138_91 [Planctomycetota bacterium]
MSQLPLFVFGTLRRGECNHGYLAGHFDQVQPARLLGFARIAPLMIARDANSVVDGELFWLTPANYESTLAGCDRLEELPGNSLIGDDYRRIAVRVQTESNEVVAWAYARPEVTSDADLLPLIVAESQRLAELFS